MINRSGFWFTLYAGNLFFLRLRFRLWPGLRFWFRLGLNRRSVVLNRSSLYWSWRWCRLFSYRRQWSFILYRWNWLRGWSYWLRLNWSWHRSRLFSDRRWHWSFILWRRNRLSIWLYRLILNGSWHRCRLFSYRRERPFVLVRRGRLGIRSDGDGLYWPWPLRIILVARNSSWVVRWRSLMCIDRF